jgi:hypothetical protein
MKKPLVRICAGRQPVSKTHTEAVRIEPTIVVLPGAVWRSELTAELERLGIPPDQAPMAAAHALHRICGHAGYRRAFLVGDEDEAPTTEEG